MSTFQCAVIIYLFIIKIINGQTILNCNCAFKIMHNFCVFHLRSLQHLTFSSSNMFSSAHFTNNNMLLFCCTKCNSYTYLLFNLFSLTWPNSFLFYSFSIAPFFMYLLTPIPLLCALKRQSSFKNHWNVYTEPTSRIDWIHLYDYWREIFLCKCFMFHIEFSVKSLDL